MTATVLSIDMIVSDPKIRKGRPIVAGRGLRVQDVVAAHLYRGLTPEELATAYALNLAQVHAALAYYYLHKSEIDQNLRDDHETAERLRAEFEAEGKLITLD